MDCGAKESGTHILDGMTEKLCSKKLQSAGRSRTRHGSGIETNTQCTRPSNATEVVILPNGRKKMKIPSTRSGDSNMV